MERSQSTSFGGRFEYLGAVQEHWPEVLSSLRRVAFPVYERCLLRNQLTEGTANISPQADAMADAALRTLSGLSKALKRSPSRELEKVHQTLLAWAGALGIEDQWILDAALQSMRVWADGASLGKWTYIAAELKTPAFQPSIGTWIPYFMSWREFKRHADQVHRRELAEYHAKVGKLWAQGKRSLTEQAVWTVQWQRGKSPEWIKQRHPKPGGGQYSLAHVQTQVHEFADAIGLTLRSSKAGPRRNKYHL